jgi:hypothetical protein
MKLQLFIRTVPSGLFPEAAMDNARIPKTLAILNALSSGIDPLSGESFPRDSAYQHPDVVRALFHALSAVEDLAAAPPAAMPSPAEGKKKPSRSAAANAGKAWSPEEDERLATGFDAGMAIEALAAAHDRSRFAIETRLARLGRLPVPEGLRYPLKTGEASKLADAATLRYAVPHRHAPMPHASMSHAS